MFKRIFISMQFIFLIGCTTNPAKVLSMIATPVTRLEKTNRFFQKIELGATTGSALRSFGPDVTNESFEVALFSSLKRFQAISVEGAGKYVLDSSLKSVESPSVGIEFSSSAAVNYRITEKTTGQILLNQTINSRGKASFSDGVLGSDRARVARERSIKENFEKLFELLHNFKD